MGTAFLQLDGALCFRSTVTRWLRGSTDWLSLSTPFHYLVAADSVVAPEALAGHYDAVSERCRARFAQSAEHDYLGLRPDSLARPLESARIAQHFEPSRICGAFETQERAIDTEVMAGAIRQAAPYAGDESRALTLWDLSERLCTRSAPSLGSSA